jgi:DNA-binding HxlR family transcriptional regulator
MTVLKPRDVEGQDFASYETPEPLRILGKRWSVPIIKELHYKADEELGFMELRRRLSNISPKVLSQRLREMVAGDLLKRTEYNNTIPRRVQYTLTDKGIVAYRMVNRLT